MKYNCDLISDLLPLYKDDICSEATKKIVEEHLAECPECRKMLADMSDVTIDEKIVKEKDEVINSQAKFFKRKSAFAGSIIALIFSIPILVCLIVNLATGAGLTWFFIVLASMLIPASLIIVPLMAPDNKFLWTIGSFTASLFILFAVCSIYSRSNWFFIASSAVLFGLSIPFMPLVVNTKPVSKLLGNNKALTVVGTYTLTFALMMLFIGLKVKSLFFFQAALAFSLPPLLFMWAMFALIRLPKWNGLLKTASCILAAALIYFFNDTIVYLLLGQGLHFVGFDTTLTTTDSLNSMICWIVLVTGIITAAIFAIFGFIRLSKKDKKEIKK